MAAVTLTRASHGSAQLLRGDYGIFDAVFAPIVLR